MAKRTIKNPEFWLALVLVLLTIFVLFVFYPRSFIMTINPIYHWLSWVGASYISIAVPVLYVLKNRYTNRYQWVMRIHIFGNLVAIAIISAHVTYQIGGPPILGTFTHLGLTLVIAFVLLVITGFMLRYQLLNRYRKSIRFVHVSLITTFYLVLIVHILHGLSII
jgi:hypothetical protein